MKKFLLAVGLASLSVASCSKPAAPLKDSYPVTVDYGVSDATLLSNYENVANLKVHMIGVEKSTGVETIQMKIMPNSMFDPDSLGGYRYATQKELLDFSVQHPDITGPRKGICARGTEYIYQDDNSQQPSKMWPVITHGNSFGYWSNCYWIALVLKPPA